MAEALVPSKKRVTFKIEDDAEMSENRNSRNSSFSEMLKQYKKKTKQMRKRELKRKNITKFKFKPMDMRVNQKNKYLQRRNATNHARHYDFPMNLRVDYPLDSDSDSDDVGIVPDLEELPLDSRMKNLSITGNESQRDGFNYEIDLSANGSAQSDACHMRGILKKSKKFSGESTSDRVMKRKKKSARSGNQEERETGAKGTGFTVAQVHNEEPSGASYYNDFN